MRVLFVINSLQVGGAESLMVQLLPRLREKGITADIFVFSKSGSFLETELETQNISVFYASESTTVYSLANVSHLHRYLKQHSYDIVHVHLFPAQLWAALALQGLRVRPVLMTTEHSTYNRRRKWCFYPLDRWMYSRYSHVVCISQGVASALLQWLPYLKESRVGVSVIENGIQVDRFKLANEVPKDRLIGSASGHVILFVARFEEQKDHDTLLKAVARLADVHLVLAGDGPRRPQVEALALRLGLHHRVHFLGRRNDVPELMKTADVYVHSVHWEGFGLAVVEAMAASLPIIASRVPGLEGVVGDAALLFEPGNDRELASLLDNVLKNTKLRASLSARSIQRCQLYSLDIMIERYVELYEKLLASATS